MLNRTLLLFAALLLAATSGCGQVAPSAASPAPTTGPVVLVVPSAAPSPTPIPAPTLKYIFLFIGDGMGQNQVQAANEALLADNRSQLLFLNFPVTGSAHTNNIKNETTDSAAAATAIASGKKTINGYLGLDEDKNRVSAISEFLRDNGMKIGILTTVSLDHATPAGFYAHVDSRRSYDSIADDLFASGFDFFAGGRFHETPDSAEHAAENGYVILSSPAETASADEKVILSSNLTFGDFGVSPAIDGGARRGWLKDSTALAISRLENPNGFFMMVEGGRIDYFCHYNDAGSFVAELIDMNEAVGAALAFYSAHPTETLILVTADHETGDVSLVNGDRAALLRQTISCDTCDDTLVSQCVAAKTPFAEALPLFAKAFGLINLTPEETAALEKAYAHTLKGDLSSSKANEEYGVYEPMTSACASIVAARAGVHFGSNGHTSQAVSVYALGVGSEFFAGFYENTKIHDNILQALAAYPVK
jgi:alkaline phosphatase